MPTDVLNDDVTILIDEREYSILQPPDYSDPLVQQKAEDILQTIDLSELTENLSMAVELFWVAYNGVAGARSGHQALQADVARIQTDMAVTCNDCVLTLVGFQRASRDVIRNITRSYKWLLRTKEGLAIKTLGRCGDIAASLADDAMALADSFADLQERTTNVHIATIGARQDQHDRVLELQQQLDETKRALESQKVNRDEIAATISKVSKLRIKAEEREEAESKRAMIAQITGAFAGALGAELGAAGQIMAARRGGVMAPGAAPAAGQPQPASAPQADPTVAVRQEQARQAQIDLALARQRVSELTDEIADINDEIAEVRGKIADVENGNWTPHQLVDLTEPDAPAEGSGGAQHAAADAGPTTTRRRRPLPATPVERDEHLAELRDDLDVLQGDLAAAQKDKIVADADVARLSNDPLAREAALAGATSGLNSAATSANAMATQAQQARQEFAEQSMQLLQQEMDLEDEKRAALIKIKEAAMKIEHLDVVQGRAEVSEEALGAAIGALGRIVDLLLTASRFWYQLAAECRSLADADLVTVIQDLADPDMGLLPEERLEEYRDPYFVEDWLDYVCRWTALQGLTRTYLVEANKAAERAGDTLEGTGLSIEDALRQAPDLARRMQMSISERLEESEAASAELEQFLSEMSNEFDLSSDTAGTEAFSSAGGV